MCSAGLAWCAGGTAGPYTARHASQHCVFKSSFRPWGRVKANGRLACAGARAHGQACTIVGARDFAAATCARRTLLELERLAGKPGLELARLCGAQGGTGLSNELQGALALHAK